VVVRNIGPAFVDGSGDRFGYEWSTYPELRPDHETQFRGWTCHLQPDDWRGLTFLDVGCGMGRNSFWPMTYGAAGGLAIDIEERSLAAARRTLAGFPAVRVENCSAYAIGRREEFDLVFSIGVVHHLERPELALAGMVAAAKPGGRVLIWVYAAENNGWIVKFLDPMRRALFSRLPIAITHHLSLYPTAALWLALRLGFGRITYFQLVRQFSFRHLRAIVFDQILPKIAHYWPRETVGRMLRDQGLSDVRLAFVNEMSWSAIGTRPLPSRSCPIVVD
jgi:SAM-dependent methyltransferase